MDADLQQFVALTLTQIAIIASGVALAAIVILGLFHALVDTFEERG